MAQNSHISIDVENAVTGSAFPSPRAEMEEPGPGSVILLHGVNGTVAQRFRSDGQWHLINGKVTDWAGVLATSAHEPPVVIRHGVGPEEALRRIRVAMETIDDTPVPLDLPDVYHDALNAIEDTLINSGYPLR